MLSLDNGFELFEVVRVMKKWLIVTFHLWQCLDLSPPSWFFIFAWKWCFWIITWHSISCSHQGRLLLTFHFRSQASLDHFDVGPEVGVEVEPQAEVVLLFFCCCFEITCRIVNVSGSRGWKADNLVNCHFIKTTLIAMRRKTMMITKIAGPCFFVLFGFQDRWSLQKSKYQYKDHLVSY